MPARAWSANWTWTSSEKRHATPHCASAFTIGFRFRCCLWLEWSTATRCQTGAEGYAKLLYRLLLEVSAHKALCCSTARLQLDKLVNKSDSLLGVKRASVARLWPTRVV